MLFLLIRKFLKIIQLIFIVYRRRQSGLNLMNYKKYSNVTAVLEVPTPGSSWLILPLTKCALAKYNTALCK